MSGLKEKIKDLAYRGVRASAEHFLGIDSYNYLKRDSWWDAADIVFVKTSLTAIQGLGTCTLLYNLFSGNPHANWGFFMGSLAVLLPELAKYREIPSLKDLKESSLERM